MRRRLIILVGSFLLLLLVVVVVKWAVEGASGDAQQPGGRSRAGQAGARANPPGAGVPSGEAGPDSGTWLRLEDRDDETHRLSSIYILPNWRKRDDGSYVAYNPCIELRQANGQRVYVTADEAVLRLEEVAGGSFTPRGGRVYSTDPDSPMSVRIYLDRSKDAERPSFTDLGNELTAEDVFASLDDRREDMVRIYAEDLSFDENKLEIRTDNDVVVFSPEADIRGKGLVLQWNERPNELRLFQITHGGLMQIKNIPPDVELIAMLGEEEEAPDGDGESVDAAGDAAVEDAVAPSAEPTGASPGDAPAVTADAVESADQDAEAKAQNMYRAVFNDSVSVTHGAQRLWGADTLALRFEWGGQAEERLRERVRDEQEGGAGSPGPATPAEPDATTSDGAEAEPGESRQAQPAVEPVVIVWSGELVATPTGYTPDPSPRNYVVTAVGNLVHLEDLQAIASCQQAEFRHPARTGDLIGTVDDPARMYLAGGQEIITPDLHFDLPDGKVTMTGPGAIIQAPEDAQQRPSDAELPQIGLLSDAGSITWQGDAKAFFGTETVTDDDGIEQRRQYIKYAVFAEDVVLIQGLPVGAAAVAGDPAGTAGPSDGLPAGDFLRCDKMEVWMADGAPSQALAEGGVVARQEGSLIHAGAADIFFDEVEDVREDGEIVTRLRPTEVQAREGVTITDTGDPTKPVEDRQEPVVARAERVQSYLLDRTAILFGSGDAAAEDDSAAPRRQRVLTGEVGHAEIVQGNRRLSGVQIFLDQDTQSAIVMGEGHMRMFTDRDLSGNPLPSSRPVDITWQDRMEYYGKKNDANFIGDVELTSEKDSMTCRQLRALFERADDSPEEPAEEEADSARRRMGVDIERYSQRRLSMIMAFNDVVVRSRRENDTGELVGRLQMTGDRLMYDIPAKELSVFGDGTLVAEDYDVAAADGEPRASTDAAGNPTLEAPSQTAFLWTREMQLMQPDRQVRLIGDVEMIHRSGDQVVVMPGLNVPGWDRLASGRKSSLHCGELFAQFAPPSAPSAQETVSGDMWESGPRLGPLELFSAFRKVEMTDGPVQIRGEQLAYNRRRGSAVVLGFLGNQPVRDASLIYKSPTGETQSWSSPKMTIDIRDGQITKVYTETVTGTGGVLPME